MRRINQNPLTKDVFHNVKSNQRVFLFQKQLQQLQGSLLRVKDTIELQLSRVFKIKYVNIKKLKIHQMIHCNKKIQYWNLQLKVWN